MTLNIFLETQHNLFEDFPNIIKHFWKGQRNYIKLKKMA